MKQLWVAVLMLWIGIGFLAAGRLDASDVLPGECREPGSCYSCHHIYLSDEPKNCSVCHSGYYEFDYGAGCCTSGVYATIGNMAIGRWSAQYTILPDNRVLTTGGYSHYVGLMNGLAKTFEDTAEIFDPSSGTSRLLESTMSSSRINHTVTLLNNGTVLVAGGSSSKYSDEGELLASAEIFDPVTEQFTPTGSMHFARCRHSATLLNDGRVLIAGGSTDLSYAAARGRLTAEVYDPESGTFSFAWFMTERRHNHAAVLLDDGSVFIAGGSRGPGTSNVLASTEIFDPLTGLFTHGPDMSAGRLGIGTVKMRDGSVLMGPGVEVAMINAFRGELPLHISNDSEIFDPADGTFAPSDPTVPESAYMHEIGDYQTYALLDGTVLRADGGDELWEYPVGHLFDPKTNTYSYTGSAKYPRWEKNAVMLKDGRPLEIGGYHMLYGFIRRIEVYTPSLQSQVAGLDNAVSDLSGDVFVESGARSRLVEQLESISSLIEQNDYESALACTKSDIIAAMDGCFDGDASDDLIADCRYQRQVYYVARLLAETLELNISGNQPPAADASADVVSGEKPLTVTFTARGSDEDGEVMLYNWDFGDYELGSGQAVSHEYRHVGTYTATLTVVDDCGAEATDNLTITVTESGKSYAASYQAHVSPVLDAFCHNCHPAGGAGGRKLMTYEQVMAEGERGPIVVPYDPDASRLIQYLESGHPISHAPHGYGSTFVDDFRSWIAEGALNN